METNSITNIKNLKESLEKALTDYKTRLKENGHLLGSTIGYENEYTISGLIAGINNMLTDISFLVRYNNIFLKLSTFTERNNITTHLRNIEVHLNNFDFRTSIKELESLKAIIRSYNIRDDKKRYIEYNEVMDNLVRKTEEVDEILQDIKKVRKKSNEQIEKINTNDEKYENQYSNLLKQFEKEKTDILEIQQLHSKLATLLEETESYHEQIVEKFNDAASNEKVIQKFSENVSSRENQLIDQKTKTDAYNKKLAEFEESHKKYLEKAEQLINDSQEALKLTTTVGISAAFSQQYEIANRKSAKIGWLIGTFSFLVITIGLGVWVVGGWWINDPENMRNVLGRIALLPLSLLGSIFCANQYVKLHNIAEDYAYKTVLAKSLIAFSSELNKHGSDGKYEEYITSVLGEIHRDPLRKRGKEEKYFQSNFDLIKRIFDWCKQATE